MKNLLILFVTGLSLALTGCAMKHDGKDGCTMGADCKCKKGCKCEKCAGKHKAKNKTKS